MPRRALVDYAFLQPEEDTSVQTDRKVDDVQPKGKRAFGYRPERWPSAKMFWSPVEADQAKIIRRKARERSLPEQELSVIRSLVLNAYGVGDANSKGNAALLIDWLMNADEDAIDSAIQAAARQEDPPMQSRLLEEEEVA
jgi:hypothetical protein